MSGCKLAEEALPSYDDRWLRGPHAEETFRPQRSCPQTHYIGFVWLLCVCRMETKTGTLASIEIPPPHNWSQGEKFVTAICPQFLQFPTNSRNFLQLSPHFPRRFSSLIHPAAGRCRRDGLYLQLYSNQLVHLFIDAQGPSLRCIWSHRLWLVATHSGLGFFHHCCVMGQYGLLKCLKQGVRSVGFPLPLPSLTLGVWTPRLASPHINRGD